VENIDYDEIVTALYKRPDMEDCKWCIIAKDMDMDEIKAHYHDHRDDIVEGDSGIPIGDYSSTVDFWDTVKAKASEYLGDIIGDTDWFNEASNNVRKCTYYKMQYYRVPFLLHEKYPDEPINAEGIPGVKGFEGVPGFELVYQPMKRVAVVISASHKILDKFYLPMERLPVAPVHIKHRVKRTDKVMQDAGPITVMIGPQDNLNVRHKQSIDTVNQGGAVLFDNSMVEPADEDNFQENFGDRTQAIKLREGAIGKGNIPRRLEQVTPNASMAMEQQAMDIMEKASNIVSELVNGGQTASQSGTSRQIQIRQAIGGNIYIYKGFKIFQKTRARIMLQFIQEVLEVEDVISMLQAFNTNSTFSLNIRPDGSYIGAGEAPTPFGEIDPKVVEALLKTKDKEGRLIDWTDFHISMSEQAWSPSVRESVYHELIELAGQMPGETDWFPMIIRLHPGIPEKIKSEFVARHEAALQRKMQIESGKINAQGGSMPMGGIG
jgi:hypothetical protein